MIYAPNTGNYLVPVASYDTYMSGLEETTRSSQENMDLSDSA